MRFRRSLARSTTRRSASRFRILTSAVAGGLVLAGACLLTAASPAAAVDTAWQLQTTLVPTGGADGEFGHAVAVSGDTAVVSAPTHGTWGAVYVFARSGGVWSQQAEIDSPDPGNSQNMEFGWAVAISGDTLAVSEYAPSCCETPIDGNGQVWVYTRSGTTWSEVAMLQGPFGFPGDGFGWF